MGEWLQGGANIAAIITLLIAIVGGVVYREYKSKKIIKGNEQKISGSGNVQAGGDIVNQQNAKSAGTKNESDNINETKVQKIIGNKQSIKGDNNKQAGGGIND